VTYKRMAGARAWGPERGKDLQPSALGCSSRFLPALSLSPFAAFFFPPLGPKGWDGRIPPFPPTGSLPCSSSFGPALALVLAPRAALYLCRDACRTAIAVYTTRYLRHSRRKKLTVKKNKKWSCIPGPVRTNVRSMYSLVFFFFSSPASLPGVCVCVCVKIVSYMQVTCRTVPQRAGFFTAFAHHVLAATAIRYANGPASPVRFVSQTLSRFGARIPG
jgi:hypothetical protein